MYFLHYSHLLFSNYAEFMLRVLNIGDFRKLGWISFSSEYFSKSLIVLCPICYLCIYIGPLWQFDQVLRHFSICSFIFHNCCALLHVMCSTDCLGDSSVLFWTQLSSNLWCWSCLIILCVFYTLCSICASMPYHAHPRHLLGTSSWINTCTIMHQHMHPHAHTCTSTYLHAFCLYVLSLSILAY